MCWLQWLKLPSGIKVCQILDSFSQNYLNWSVWNLIQRTKYRSVDCKLTTVQHRQTKPFTHHHEDIQRCIRVSAKTTETLHSPVTRANHTDFLRRCHDVFDLPGWAAAAGVKTDWSLLRRYLYRTGSWGSDTPSAAGWFAPSSSGTNSLFFFFFVSLSLSLSLSLSHTHTEATSVWLRWCN